MLLQADYPVVMPRSMGPTVVQYSGVGQEDDDFIPQGSIPVPSSEEAKTAERAAAEAKMRADAKRFLLFGMGGVMLGALLNTGITALAFGAYRRSEGKSVLGPALLAGAGSAVTGGALVFVLYKSMMGQLDERIGYAATGASLAR